MSSSTKKTFLKKIFSLLSVVRGYNILILIIAQYLASIFIFSSEKSLRNVLFDVHLHFLIIATVCVVSAGYIINNFYDVKIDRINRPLKSGIDSYVKQETKLSLYFFLNFLGCFFGLLVSWRAALFFSVYIFGIWLYSHKLKKYSFIGLLSATILTILPFFVVFIHYKNFSKIIFVHATFFSLVIMVRELIKDLENLKGAIVNNYQTFPVTYGESFSKKVSVFILMLTLIPVIILLNFLELNYMRFYYYFSAIILAFISFSIIKSKSRKDYRIIHNVLKVLLLLGVFSLVFIDTSLLLEKVINRIN